MTPTSSHLSDEQYKRLEKQFVAVEKLKVMNSDPSGCRYLIDELNWADLTELGQHLPDYKAAFESFSEKTPTS
jgi:hypothetical protein